MSNPLQAVVGGSLVNNPNRHLWAVLCTFRLPHTKAATHHRYSSMHTLTNDSRDLWVPPVLCTNGAVKYCSPRPPRSAGLFHQAQLFVQLEGEERVTHVGMAPPPSPPPPLPAPTSFQSLPHACPAVLCSPVHMGMGRSSTHDHTSVAC